MNYSNVSIIGAFLFFSIIFGCILIWYIIREKKKKKKEKEEEEKDEKEEKIELKNDEDRLRIVVYSRKEEKKEKDNEKKRKRNGHGKYYKKYFGWICLTAFLLAFLLLIYSNLGVFLIERLKNQNRIDGLENEARKIISKSNETLTKATENKVAEKTVANIDNLVSGSAFYIKLKHFTLFDDVSLKYDESYDYHKKIERRNDELNKAVTNSDCIGTGSKAKLKETDTHIPNIETILSDISRYLTNEVKRRFLAFNNIFSINITLLLQQFEDDIDQLLKFCEELLNQPIKMEIRTFFIVFFIFFLFYSLILAIFIVLSILGFFILFKEPPIPPEPVIELPPRGYVPEKTEIPIPKPKQSKMQHFVKYSLYGSILLLFISSITYLVIYLEVLEPTNNCAFKKNNDSISLISICPTPNSEFFSILPFGSSFSQTGLEKSLNFSENKKRFDEKADKSLGYKEYKFNDVRIDFDEEVEKMSYFGKEFEKLKKINCTDEILDDASTDFKHLHTSLVELNSSIVKFNEKRIKSKHFIDMFETHPFDEIRRGTRIAVAPILAANFKCTTIYELIYANCRLNGFVLDDFVFYVIIQLSSNTIVIFFNFVILELKKLFNAKLKMDEVKRFEVYLVKKAELMKKREREDEERRLNGEIERIDRWNANEIEHNEKLKKKLARVTTNLEREQIALQHEINFAERGVPIPEMQIDGCQNGILPEVPEE